MIIEVLFIIFLAFTAVGLLTVFFGDTKTFQAIDNYIADWINRQRGVE